MLVVADTIDWLLKFCSETQQLDITIKKDGKQRRWKIGFRIFLVSYFGFLSSHDSLDAI